MSDPKETILLSYRAEADGEPVTSLSMRRAKARDSRDAQRGGGSPADVEIRLFANLCEVSTDTIESLDMADYTRLQDAYQRFLAG